MAGLKIFAVFLVLAFVFELAFTTHDGVMFDEECAQEVGIDKGTLVEFNLTRPIETDNEKIKCYLKCSLKRTGWMTPDGEMKEGPYLNERLMAQYKPLVAECLSTKGSNDCETAFLFYKCLANKAEGN